MKLEILTGEYSVCRLSPDANIPKWALSHFSSITRTGHELSIVCRSQAIPDGVQREDGWKLFRIAGQLEFSMIGVIAAISKVLCEASISIFVISSFDTDYVMVKADQFAHAAESLTAAGYTFQDLSN